MCESPTAAEKEYISSIIPIDQIRHSIRMQKGGGGLDRSNYDYSIVVSGHVCAIIVILGVVGATVGGIYWALNASGVLPALKLTYDALNLTIKGCGDIAGTEARQQATGWVDWFMGHSSQGRLPDCADAHLKIRQIRNEIQLVYEANRAKAAAFGMFVAPLARMTYTQLVDFFIFVLGSAQCRRPEKKTTRTRRRKSSSRRSSSSSMAAGGRRKKTPKKTRNRRRSPRR